MKAAVISAYGGYENLHIQDIKQPSPCSGEVLIKVEASSINDFDRAMTLGRPFVLRLSGPFKPSQRVLGCDIAGTVAELGKGVSNIRVGDRVMVDGSNQKWGGYGQYTIAKASSVALLSDDMSFIEAAALPHSGVLAIQAIREINALQEGKRIAVNGAGGGAGQYVIKLAKKHNMHVTAIDKGCKLDFLTYLGADSVIDYEKENFTELESSYDFIIDFQAHKGPPCYRRVLNENGQYIMVGGSSTTIIANLILGIPSNPFTSKKVKILGHRQNKEDLEQLISLYHKCDISPVIDSVFDLHEIHEAFKRYESGDMKGKIIIDMSTVN